MHRSIFKVLALGTAAVFPLTGLFWATPSDASRYRREFNAEEFHQCANELLTTGMAADQTQVACSMALEPTDLSSCVVQIDGFTVIEEDEALFSCFRVRRPLELAECVVDINLELLEPQEATVALASSTLNHCRRSLLPLRFSACVRGLSQESYPSAFEPDQALATCIDAEDFPREIYTPSTNSTDGRGI